MTRHSISTGPNARPKDETISATGKGLPNDSSRPPAVDEGEIEKVRRKLAGGKEKEEDKGRELPGAEGLRSAGAEEDTYD